MRKWQALELRVLLGRNKELPGAIGYTVIRNRAALESMDQHRRGKIHLRQAATPDDVQHQARLAQFQSRGNGLFNPDVNGSITIRTQLNYHGSVENMYPCGRTVFIFQAASLSFPKRRRKRYRRASTDRSALL
jgi:hypothetical protein